MALFSTFLLSNIDLSLLFNYRFPTLPGGQCTFPLRKQKYFSCNKAGYTQTRTPAAVFGYHPSSAKLAFWTQYKIARLL